MAHRLVDLPKNASCRQPLRVTGIKQVVLWEQVASHPQRIWKLIPVLDENPSTAFSDEHKAAPPYSTK